MSRSTATLIGFTAVLMWAVLAFLTAASGQVPPFQLAAMTFLIGGLLGIATWPFRTGVVASMPRDWRVWLLGVAGLFGYHFVYFTAIRSAPPVEVSLLAYLWPLFLVAFSALLPGEKLKVHHILGVVIGLLGAALVITRGQGFTLTQGFGLGHALGFSCAIIWAAYSVLSRRFGNVSTDVVAGFCLITSALAFLCHLLFETTVWPEGHSQWLAILGLGLFPVGGRLLQLGPRGQARRHHGARRLVLCLALAVDIGADAGGLRALSLVDLRRLPAHHRGRRHRGEGHDLQATLMR